MHTYALAPAAAKGQVAVVLCGFVRHWALNIEAVRVKGVRLVPKPWRPALDPGSDIQA